MLGTLYQNAAIRPETGENALDLEKTIVRQELFPLSGLYGAYILAKNALEGNIIN